LGPAVQDRAMAQTPILTVTLNPALDVSARVSRMVAGPKLRLGAPVHEPGGGGVNVARVVNILGGRAQAWVALGGAAGAQHLALMQALGMDVQPFAAPGETRANWAITDATGQQYRLQLPGPDWTADYSARALADIVARAAGLVVLSGSLPPGVADDFATTLSNALPASVQLCIDTSGPALAEVIRRPRAIPYLLRLDQAEAEEQAHHPLVTIPATVDFARKLLARGVARHVCIAHGADGSVLAGPDGLALHARPPLVPVRSKVGAGDSFMGAYVLAIARGQDAGQALVQGTAAAAATVMTDGTALCRPEDVARLRAECSLIRLAP
jgi:6-phosphofructokinase 2